MLPTPRCRRAALRCDSVARVPFADKTIARCATPQAAKRARKAEKEAKKALKAAAKEKAVANPAAADAAKVAADEASPSPASSSDVSDAPAKAVVPATPGKPDLAAIKAFLSKHEVRVHSSSAPPPVLHLADAPFAQSIVRKLLSFGFTEPSAVQAASWPLAVGGRDLLAIAKTGSGKTLGFLLPALAVCMAAANKHEPSAVVMAPTRELALQTHTEAQKFCAPTGVRTVCLYGGASKGPQAQQLRRGAGLLVATPGRLMDFLDLTDGSRGYGPQTSVSKVQMLVLDEADRMLDMGFEKDVMKLASNMPADKQTLLYTATWPKAVQRVAGQLLRADKMVKLTVGSGGDKLTANKSITQHVQVVQPNDKWEAFLRMVKPLGPGGEMAGERAIIFCNTKRDAAGVADHLWQEGYAIDVITGDRTQGEREQVVKQFKAGKISIMCCTDVAARGLDISDVKAVYNMDFPRDSAEDYVHRIGRTGRAGNTGVSHTLFTAKDVRHGAELMRILSDAGQEVPAELERMVGRNKGRKGGGGGFRGGGGRGGGFRGGGGARRHF